MDTEVRKKHRRSSSLRSTEEANLIEINGITNPNLFDILSRRLPEDIVYGILFIRLTVEDLFRLRLVCKSWLALIFSPDFNKIRDSKVTSDPHFTHHRLLLSRRNDDQRIVLEGYSLYSLLNEPFTNTIQLEYPDEPIDRVVGYCNGLVCLVCHYSDNNYVILWNPTTGKSRTVPKPEDVFDNAGTKYGFCYDESNDDFKVFAISGCRPYEYEASVYSSKSDSWRMIEDLPCAEVLSDGSYVNGAMYWRVGTYDMMFDNKTADIIVSLDIKADTYGEILQPNYGEGAKYDWTLGSFGKRLSILCKFETCADFWVMKECGLGKSWTRLYTIPYLDRLTQWSHFKPICISVNGDIILNFDSTIVLYSSKDNTYKDLLHSYCWDTLDVYTYVESLVPPPLVESSSTSSLNLSPGNEEVHELILSQQEGSGEGS